MVKRKEAFNFDKEKLLTNDKRIWCLWNKGLYEKFAKEKLSTIFNSDITLNPSIIIAKEQIAKIHLIQQYEIERNIINRQSRDISNETKSESIARMKEESIHP